MIDDPFDEVNTYWEELLIQNLALNSLGKAVPGKGSFSCLLSTSPGSADGQDVKEDTPTRGRKWLVDLPVFNKFLNPAQIFSVLTGSHYLIAVQGFFVMWGRGEGMGNQTGVSSQHRWGETGVSLRPSSHLTSFCYSVFSLPEIAPNPTRHSQGITNLFSLQGGLHVADFVVIVLLFQPIHALS